MSPGSEVKLQLMHRAYCYLRLCGFEEDAALAGVRASLDEMARVEAGDGVWSHVEALGASVRGELAPVAPPLLRGHMVYPP